MNAFLKADTPVRVYVVEDHPKILKNQVRLLREHPEIEIVGAALSGEAAMDAIATTKPEVILLDLGLPRINGIEVTRQVKTRWPSVEVLLFTVFDEEEKVLEAVRAGASGYILKGTSTDRIIEAIQAVRNGGAVIQPRLARAVLKHFRAESTTEASLPEMQRRLSPREGEILQLIAKGVSNAEAARILGIAATTIRTHLEHIYQKLEVTNRVEAVTEGIRKKLIGL